MWSHNSVISGEYIRVDGLLQVSHLTKLHSTFVDFKGATWYLALYLFFSLCLKVYIMLIYIPEYIWRFVQQFINGSDAQTRILKPDYSLKPSHLI